MPRTIAIGDIHGCSKPLDALLDAIEPATGDRIVTLGDYVDRGPDSQGVLERLIELESAGLLVPLLGNHEEMMIAALAGRTPRDWWLHHGGEATLASYGADGVPEQHLEFLDRCRDSFQIDQALFTHASYVPDEPLDRQPAEALRWQSLEDGVPEPHESGKRAYVGHTAQRSGEVLRTPHLWCLDTYCHGGGWLSACDVASGFVWQADREGRLRADQ